MASRNRSTPHGLHRGAMLETDSPAQRKPSCRNSTPLPGPSLTWRSDEQSQSPASSLPRSRVTCSLIMLVENRAGFSSPARVDSKIRPCPDQLDQCIAPRSRASRADRLQSNPLAGRQRYHPRCLCRIATPPRRARQRTRTPRSLLRPFAPYKSVPRRGGAGTPRSSPVPTP